MPKLFAVYLGGKHEKANIEVHDMVFVVGENLAETFPKIREKWFGVKSKVHIDSWIELSQVGGYDLSLVAADEPLDILDETENPKLFFINFGATKANKIEEIHESSFFVANSRSEAISQARKELCTNFSDIHLDDLMEVDDCLELDLISNYKVVLTKAETILPLKICTQYTKIS